MRVEMEGYDSHNPLDRASQVSVCAGAFARILYGTPPKAPYKWTAIPIVMSSAVDQEKGAHSRSERARADVWKRSLRSGSGSPYLRA